MAHKRTRFILPIFKKILGYSPIIGLLGHRQVGKTTLLEDTCSEYLTLDDRETLAKLNENPKLFLEKHKALHVGIDESQLSPDLFPALKERVRTDKRPGQYILSGSVRFTSRKAIRESLTGRIVNLELLPFTISEINHQERPFTARKILGTQNLEQCVESLKAEISVRKKYDPEIDLYLKNGGLPGICFVRDKTLRETRIREQFLTLLDRDIRLVYPTTLPYIQILDFVKFLSRREGYPFQYNEAKNETGLSVPTQKKLLFALEAIFLIRILPIYSGEKGVVIYFEDQAEALYLNNQKDLSLQMEGLIYRHIRQEFYYELGKNTNFFHYSTRGGARVPIAVESDGTVIGFIPLINEEPTRSQRASADSFLKSFEKSKVIFLNRKTHYKVINSRIAILPYVLFC